MVVAVIMTLVLFSGGPNGAISFAQQQPTPANSIKWLNPETDTSTEISAKPDGSGGATASSYHLVATVNSLPASPSVTFAVKCGSALAVEITPVTQVGADTFQADWQGTAMPADGECDLIASLRSSGTEINTDAETVMINNATSAPPGGLDPTTAQAETIEITSPTNGSALNFTDPPGTPRFTAVIQVKHSADVTEVTPYYTVTAPGVEPVWTECANGVQTAAEAANGVECELASPTFPTQVTGIAVVVADAPLDPIPEPDVDSGDGHRVIGAGATPPPTASPTTASPSSPSGSPTTSSPSPTPTTASPSPSASTPPPPIAYSSTTTIDYNGKAFTGKVKSDARKCRSGRNVLLMKEKGNDAKKVGSDRTNKKGNYSINEPDADGTYYTVAKAKGFTDNAGRPVTCAQDKSKKRKV
jgi:hypothetical protein